MKSVIFQIKMSDDKAKSARFSFGAGVLVMPTFLQNGISHFF
jgi:hypothetical protein